MSPKAVSPDLLAFRSSGLESALEAIEARAAEIREEAQTAEMVGRTAPKPAEA